MNYIINTPCGQIQGIIEKNNTISYKGIRYANAKRFEYPSIVTSWEGIYDATKYGHCAYQPRSFYNEEEMPKKIFYYNEFRKGETYTYSEDCLFLNIFTPENAKEKDNLPVLLYIHGGGFTGGCGHEKHFNEPVWPTKGIIGVTINYRLGPLGFICLEELKQKDGHTGNYGLYDQITAIQWIKNNIASFGGDPNNITIMGQSAGAMSVQHLCLSPLAKGLFNKAVMSSGGGVSKMMPRYKEEKTFKFWKHVMALSNCNSLEEFKNVPVDILFDSWNKTRKELKAGLIASSPVIDGKLIIGSWDESLKTNSYKNISYMIGSTSEDMLPPILYKMSLNWCKKQESSTYCWMFNHQLPGDNEGAWHSSDLWYWFDTIKKSWRPSNDIDFELADKMSSYLVNFVKNGNPNGNDLPLWEATSKRQNKVMHLGNGSFEMKRVKTGKLWHNLFSKKAVGE